MKLLRGYGIARSSQASEEIVDFDGRGDDAFDARAFAIATDCNIRSGTRIRKKLGCVSGPRDDAGSGQNPGVEAGGALQRRGPLIAGRFAKSVALFVCR
jgi:hypothetical protein